MKLVQQFSLLTLACLFAGQPMLAQSTMPRAQAQTSLSAWIAKEYLKPEAYEQATQQLQAPLQDQGERVKPSFFSRWWKGITAEETLEPLPPAACKPFAFHTFFVTEQKNKHVTQATLQTLGVFKPKSLMATLNRTKTAVGEAAFANFLSHPITDINKLRTRQHALQSLVDNRELLAQLGNSLNKFAAVEGHLYKLWQFRPLFEHPTSLMTGRWTAGIALRGMWLADTITSIPMFIYSIVTLGLVFPFASPFLTHRNKLYYQYLSQLQTLLINVATGVQAMQEMYTALKNNPAFADGIPGFVGLKELFDSTESDIQWLISSLDTNTFKGTASFFSHWGRIVAVYQRLAIQSENLRKAIEGAGAIDAFVSMASALRDQSSSARYCFVEFLDSRRPVMNFRGLWNPLVDRGTAVPNSISLGAGQDNSRLMVINGQATTGKTTLVTSVAYAALLAQTFGVAPAASAVMTPCSQIHVINTGCSFTEQAQQLKEAVERMNLLADHEYALIVADEPFGASQANGEAAAKAWLKYLLDHRCVTVVTSNLPSVTALAQENPAVKNFKFELHKTSYGTLDRTFRLEAGIAQTNGGLGLDILREQDLLPE